VRPNLERSTRESYAGCWDRHIGPALGGHRLREITAPVARRWPDDLIAAGVGPQAVRLFVLARDSRGALCVAVRLHGRSSDRMMPDANGALAWRG
jgi:hypothetical protein